MRHAEISQKLDEFPSLTAAIHQFSIAVQPSCRGVSMRRGGRARTNGWTPSKRPSVKSERWEHANGLL